MEIDGLQRLTRLAAKYRDATAWLETWIDVTQDAEWRSIADVRRDFPSADGVKLGRQVVVTVFNVKGNTYRLLTVITYRSQMVRVVDLMTHAEYDKGKWK